MQEGLAEFLSPKSISAEQRDPTTRKDAQTSSAVVERARMGTEAVTAQHRVDVFNTGHFFDHIDPVGNIARWEEMRVCKAQIVIEQWGDDTTTPMVLTVLWATARYHHLKGSKANDAQTINLDQSDEAAQAHLKLEKS
ncbi:hypothetical protein [Ruegeria sp. R14_0]|uniref:hypothetical protein n=1 Tax=Ruegeria sp. R14_0 TaxID=2821100 RepID=UPI001ADC90B5|nr:hypothetical protein [Ruegeria sp. R14_0]MBO9447584.1 hypothetical protein [Ruegeria sp. R14_0]